MGETMPNHRVRNTTEKDQKPDDVEAGGQRLCPAGYPGTQRVAPLLRV